MNPCHSHMNNYAKRFSANQIYKERSYGEKLPAFFLILRLYNLANFLCNLLNKDIIKIQQSHSQLFLTLYFICLTRHAWETRSKVNANIFSWVTQEVFVALSYSFDENSITETKTHPFSKRQRTFVILLSWISSSENTYENSNQCNTDVLPILWIACHSFILLL